MKLVYDTKDKPSFGKLIVFAFQQLLAILAATIVVPVIVGHDMQQNAAFSFIVSHGFILTFTQTEADPLLIFIRPAACQYSTTYFSRFE